MVVVKTMQRFPLCFSCGCWYSPKQGELDREGVDQWCKWITCEKLGLWRSWKADAVVEAPPLPSWDLKPIFPRGRMVIALVRFRCGSNILIRYEESAKAEICQGLVLMTSRCTLWIGDTEKWNIYCTEVRAQIRKERPSQKVSNCTLHILFQLLLRIDTGAVDSETVEFDQCKCTLHLSWLS